MVDDIEYHLIAKYKPIIYQPTDSELQEKLLEELQYIFAKNGVNISTYNLPQISAKYINNTNQLVEEELNYDIHSLEIEASKLYCRLNNDQNNVFHETVTSFINKESKFFFICGHGGTDKTFLWNTIISFLRAQRKIVMIVASSGVASLLLPNGRTTHSRFKILIDIDELCDCDIKRGTKLTQLLIQTDLIIWDEALMANKQCFETLDRSLRDIISENSQKKNISALIVYQIVHIHVMMLTFYIQ
jgi:hypothetical protein